MRLVYCSIRLLIILFFVSCAQRKQAGTNHTISKTIAWEFLEGCETGTGKCDSVVVERLHAGDNVLINFPCGGTESEVSLYSHYSGVIRNDHRFGCEQNPRLDLGGLPDGSYSARMASCGLGGGFTLILKTLPQPDKSAL